MKKYSNIWQGNSYTVNILYSRAGLSTGILIENSENVFLLDIGDGIQRDIIEKIDSTWQEKKILLNQKLKAILITHGHFDHIGGLHTLLGFLRMIGRTDNLDIIIPDGSIEPKSLVQNFMAMYESSMPFNISLIEADHSDTFIYNDTTVISHSVIHCGSIETGEILDEIPALGYSISNSIESLAFSGDTGYCENLLELVKDKDLAVIEATYKEELGKNPDLFTKVHLSETLAHKAGALAKEHILIHSI